MLKLAMEDEETIDTFKQAFNEQDEGEKDGGSSKVLSYTSLHHWKCNLHITTPVRTSRYLINTLFMVLLCFFYIMIRILWVSASSNEIVFSKTCNSIPTRLTYQTHREMNELKKKHIIFNHCHVILVANRSEIKF